MSDKNRTNVRGPGNLGPLCILENILPDTELPVFQNIGLREVFENKRMLLAFDTGTGKTFTYAGIVRGLLNANPEKKHLLIIVHDSIEQVPNDISNLVEVSVEAFDGSAETIKRLKYLWSRTSIICLTMEAIQRLEVLNFLYRHIVELESIVIDEAHHCSNWNTSDTAFAIRTMCKWVPYVVALTATPMTRESKQFYRLMNLLDRNISMKRDQTYLGKYVDRYMPVNREEYQIKGKYKSTLVPVTPTIEQMQKPKGIVFRTIKGSGSVPQAEALVKTVKERLAAGKRCIIYVHYHDSRRWIESNLVEAGVKFVSLHGKITRREERQYILDRFRNGEVDVLITSVTESLNIEADVVIFYEFTTAVKQVVGRAHRGLDEKELEIVFIITLDTAEVDFFLQYIYNRSLTIQRLLRKDYSEFVVIGDKLIKLQESLDNSDESQCKYVFSSDEEDDDILPF